MKKHSIWLVLLIFALLAAGCTPKQPAQDPAAEPDPPVVAPQPNPEPEPQPKPGSEDALDLQQLAADIMATGAYPEMIEITAKRLKKFYDLESEQFSAFSVYLCAEAILSDEIVLLRLQNAEEADAVKEKLRLRQVDQKDSFDSYLPKEGDKIGKAIWFEKDLDLGYLVAPNEEAAEAIQTLLAQTYGDENIFFTPIEFTR